MTATSSPSNPLDCPNCSADLTFDPRTKRLTCSYCGARQAVPKSSKEKPSEQEFDKFWDKEKNAPILPTSFLSLEVNCPGCHAAIAFDPPEVAGDCPFCGTPIVSQPQSSNPNIAPNGIIPFQFGQEEALEKIRAWLNERRSVPKKFKELAQPDRVQGVYLPFWTFDCNTTTQYTGEKGTHYDIEVEYKEKDEDGNEVTCTRIEQSTDWIDVNGTVSDFCDDVLYAATYAVEKEHLNRLYPWRLSQLVSYDPSYVSGFKAQRSVSNLKTAFEFAKREPIKQHVERAVRSDIGGDCQQIRSCKTHYDNITFKHLLLPVWISSYRFEDKVYQVVVNGQTGEVAGDYPQKKYKRFFLAGKPEAIVILCLVLWVGGVTVFGVLSSTFRANSSSPVTPTPSSAPSNAPPSPSASSAPLPDSSLPASSPAQPDEAFRQAINLAGQAASQTQTAQSVQEWQEVVTLWSQAIDALNQVSPSSQNYAVARQKIQEYQVNLNYARHQVNQ